MDISNKAGSDSSWPAPVDEAWAGAVIIETANYLVKAQQMVLSFVAMHLEVNHVSETGERQKYIIACWSRETMEREAVGWMSGGVFWDIRTIWR